MFNTAICPEAFADMLQMVLKSLELHFFAKNDYVNARQTYENLIIIIINTMSGGKVTMNN